MSTKKTAGMIAELRGGLVLSCQPVPGSSFDNTKSIVAYSRIGVEVGARALRIEGVANVRAVAASVNLPVIGLVKRDLDGTPVRITPFLEDVAALADAGAAIIAFDATNTTRPTPVVTMIAAIHGLGRLAMADIATEAEARAARAAGADLVGTTLSGYTGGPVPELPDLALLSRIVDLDCPVIAEGRYNSPYLAAEALRAGAHAVVVGSAVTRPEYAARWFVEALTKARPDPRPVLTFDIGGTKTLAALVLGARVVEQRRIATRGKIGSPEWLAELEALARDWRDVAGCGAAAVSGVISSGCWSALNPDVLDIPARYPLAARLSDAIGLPFLAVNDAQAAAWGEYRHGAGRGRDMAFVTISSGIGGGLVLGGRLLRGASGIAGSLGQMCIGRFTLESQASGFALARQARMAGHEMDAAGVFAADAADARWATALVDGLFANLAGGMHMLQALADPEVIVIGGGVGLAPGALERLNAACWNIPEPLRPNLVCAALGDAAGIIGAADLCTFDENTP